MTTEVTIDGTDYRITKLDNGNIRVEHKSIQYNPMHGPDTEGLHAFEVHPCQRSWYSHWNRQLPADEQATKLEGDAAAEPWWSLRSARTDTATRSLLKQGRKTSKKASKG